jgi:hypothetical protein
MRGGVRDKRLVVRANTYLSQYAPGEGQRPARYSNQKRVLLLIEEELGVRQEYRFGAAVGQTTEKVKARQAPAGECFLH